MSSVFVKRTRIQASAATVFAFHERPDALRLLTPSWQHATIIQPPRSLAVGTRVVLRVGPWPVRLTIVAEHVAYDPGRSFTDRMVSGPFREWIHRHEVVPDGDDASFLVDDVHYALPLGTVGQTLGGPFARRELDKLFAFRHDVTRAHCERNDA